MIMSGARTAAEKEGLNLRDDQDLAKENAGLTEGLQLYSGLLKKNLGSPEVISLTAALNQKYFVCEKNPGELQIISSLLQTLHPKTFLLRKRAT